MYNETLLAMGLFAERSLYRGNLTKRERSAYPLALSNFQSRNKGRKYADPLQYQAREQNRLSKAIK